MAFNLNSIVRNDPTKSPPRFMVYADEGMGKTTMAALAPNPIFIRTEDGEGVLDIAMFPLATSFNDVMSALASLIENDHEFQTLVVDTVDHLEPLVWQEVCRRYKVSSIEDVGGGYGKGYLAAMDVWREYNEAINELRNAKKMIIIQLAHAEAKKFQNPETEAYDRYDIKMHKAASAFLKETCDVVFFINKKVIVIKDDAGFNKKRQRAKGTNDRFLYCDQRPASNAKNRYNLPAEIAFDPEGGYWGTIAQYVPFLASFGLEAPEPEIEETEETTNQTEQE